VPWADGEPRLDRDRLVGHPRAAPGRCSTPGRRSPPGAAPLPRTGRCDERSRIAAITERAGLFRVGAASTAADSRGMPRSRCHSPPLDALPAGAVSSLVSRRRMASLRLPRVSRSDEGRAREHGNHEAMPQARERGARSMRPTRSSAVFSAARYRILVPRRRNRLQKAKAKSSRTTGSRRRRSQRRSRRRTRSRSSRRECLRWRAPGCCPAGRAGRAARCP
jgi:hypothetical protein